MVLHWRQRPELERPATGGRPEAATAAGLELHPAKMAAELRPPVPMDKGDVVEELCAGLEAAAFAGDDVGDLTAFDALDRLAGDGPARVMRCASPCARPRRRPSSVARADVAVDGPAGLASSLDELGADDQACACLSWVSSHAAGGFACARARSSPARAVAFVRRHHQRLVERRRGLHEIERLHAEARVVQLVVRAGLA